MIFSLPLLGTTFIINLKFLTYALRDITCVIYVPQAKMTKVKFVLVKYNPPNCKLINLN